MSKTATKKRPAKKKSIKEMLNLKRANNARLFETVHARLTVSQELFCQLITTPGELFNNGTQAYAEAYEYELDTLDRDDAEILEEVRDPETKEIVQKYEVITPSSYDRAYAVCAANANRLLKNAKVATRINELLHEKVLDDKVVDARMAFWIMNEREPATSARMIEQYNKLRKRINDEPAKVEVYLGVDEVIQKAKEAYDRIHGTPTPAAA